MHRNRHLRLIIKVDLSFQKHKKKFLFNGTFHSFKGLPKNGSVPSFDRVRKTSQSERFKPSLAAIKTRSRGDVDGSVDVRKPHYLKYSANSLVTGYKSGSNDVVSTKQVFFSFYF